MDNLITYLILFAIICIVYFYQKQKNRKFNNSPINKKIERIYSEWYKQGGTLLNRSKFTIPELNLNVYKLKVRLDKVGISKEFVEEYKNSVEVNKKTKLGFKDVIIGVLGWFTTNRIVDDFLNLLKKTNFQTNVNKLFENGIVKSSLLILIFIIVILSFFLLLYMIASFETLHKSNQRLFVLNYLIKIWNFDLNDKEIHEDDQLKNDIIYTKLKFKKTKFDKLMEISIGDDIQDNLNTFVKLIEESSNKIIVFCRKVVVFLLGFILPIFFEILLFFLFCFLYQRIINLINHKLLTVEALLRGVVVIIFILFILVVLVIFLSLYNSQIGVFAGQKSKQPKEFLGLEYVSRDITSINWWQILLHLFIILKIICLLSKKFAIPIWVLLIPSLILVMAGYIGTRYTLAEDEI